MTNSVVACWLFNLCVMFKLFPNFLTQFTHAVSLHLFSWFPAFQDVPKIWTAQPTLCPVVQPSIHWFCPCDHEERLVLPFVPSIPLSAISRALAMNIGLRSYEPLQQLTPGSHWLLRRARQIKNHSKACSILLEISSGAMYNLQSNMQDIQNKAKAFSQYTVYGASGDTSSDQKRN